MEVNDEKIKTLVVDFYPPHLRNAIIKLRQDHIMVGKIVCTPHRLIVWLRNTKMKNL